MKNRSKNFGVVLSSSLILLFLSFFAIGAVIYTQTYNSNMTLNTQTINEPNNFTHLEINDTSERYAVFDGTNDYVQVANANTLQLNGQLGISIWVYLTRMPTVNGYIVDKQNKYTLLVNASGNPTLILNYPTAGYANVVSSVALNNNTWHHIVGNYNATGAYLWVDNNIVGSSAYSQTIATDTNPVRIGMYSNAGGATSTDWAFPGYIDEVGIWSRALTTSEITNIYNLNKTDYNGSAEGLVGYWNFDNRPNNGDDSSGLGNTGTFTNGAYTTIYDSSYTQFNNATWNYPYNSLVAYYPFDSDFDNRIQQGKIGNSIFYDGTNDCNTFQAVQTTNTTSTVSYWIYQSITGTSGMFATRGSGNTFVYFDTNDLVVRGFNSGFVKFDTNIATGSWHNIIITSEADGRRKAYLNGTEVSNLTSPYLLQSMVFEVTGVCWSTALNGRMDEVKIYNRTFDATEAMNLYTTESAGIRYSIINSTGLIRELQMENLSDFDSANNSSGYISITGTVYDLSSNNVDGTTIVGTISAPYINRSPNGIAMQKYGDYLTYTGTTGGYINVNDNALLKLTNYSSFSLNLWVNPINVTAVQTPISKWTLSPAEYGIDLLANGTVTWNVNGGTDYRVLSNKTFVNNTWNMITATWNNNNGDMEIYLDGLLVGNKTRPINLTVGTSALNIGRYSGGQYFNGSIDEVMIFSSALTAQQIADLYNNQSARFKTEGNITLQQQTLNQTATAITINNALGSNQRALNSDTWARIGYWNVTRGYNEADSSMVSYVHADANSADVVSGYSGILAGNTTYGGGAFNQSFTFDGTADYVRGNYSGNVSFESGTVSLWFNHTNTTNPSNARVVEFCDGSNCANRRMGLVITSSAPNWYFYWYGYFNSTYQWGNAAFSSPLTTIWKDNRFHHVTVTWDSNRGYMYVDGVLVSSYATNRSDYITNVTNFTIGAFISTPTTFNFNGSVDEVIVMNRTLSTIEIKELYIKGRANWSYTAYQNLSGTANTTFALGGISSNILPDFKLVGNTTQNNVSFYSPQLNLNNISFTADTPFPQNVNFTAPFAGGFQVNRTISFNVSASQYAVINVTLYNSSGALVNTSSSGSNPYAGSFLAGADGVYYINATATLVGSSNTSSTINVTVDITAPNATLISPTNASYSNNQTNNFTANISDSFSSVQNTTLNIYNSTSLVNQTPVVGFASGKAYNAGTASNTRGLISSDISVGTVFSVETWIKFSGSPNSWNDYGWVTGDAGGGGNSPILFFGANHIYYYGLGNAYKGDWFTSNFIAGSQWHHFVLARNGLTITLYLDGVSQGARSLNVNNAETFRYISAAGPSGGNIMGLVDETVIWSKELSAAEVSARYNGGTGAYLTNYTDVFATWAFEEGSGSSAADKSGNNKNLTLGGSTWATGKIKSPTNVTFDTGILQATVGIVVSLVDGVYNWFYSFFDNLGNMGTSSNSTVTVDTVYPIPVFNSHTPANDSGSNVAITISVNITELNPSNVTLIWQNGTTNILTSTYTLGNFSNISNGIWQINLTNQTSLFAGQSYYYNITITDLAGNSNTTETRVVKGNTPPIITVDQTTNASGYYNSSEIIANITIIDGEGNMNYSAVYLFFNETLSGIPSLRNISENTTQSTSINYYLNYSNLAEGVYYLSANATDLVGEITNSNATQNRTVILDRTNPTATLIYPTNNSYLANLTQNYSATLTDNFGIANATLNIFNSSGIVNQTVISYGVNVTQATIGIVVTVLDGVYTWFYNLFDWAGNQFNTQNNTVTLDVVAPTISGIAYSPNINASMDPLTNIQFNVTIIDTVAGVNTTILQIFNGTNWVNYTLEKISGTYTHGVWSNSSFNTSEKDTYYLFNIWANDTSGNSRVSSNNSFYSYYDCTWNITTTGTGNDLGATGGFNNDLEIGNITIINEGDANYSINNCTQTFTLGYNKASIFYPDFSIDYLLEVQDTSDTSTIQGLNANYSSLPYTVNISAKTNAIVIISAGFPNPSSVLTEMPKINLTSSINDTVYGRNREQIDSTLIVTPGASLFMEIENPSTSEILVPLEAGLTNFRAYLKDVVSGAINTNNTAYNVSFNWTIPSVIAGLFSGDTTINEVTSNQTLNDTSKIYLNLTLDLNSANLVSLTQTNYTLRVYGYGYENSTGNLTLINHSSGQIIHDSIILRFYCSDTTSSSPALACRPATTPTTPSSSSGGGGGGGGGGGTTEKSEATYELVRGEQNSFQLEVRNKLSNPKKNINITVKGINSQYIDITPKTIDYLAGESTTNLTVSINAPSYFSQTNYTLTFVITGDIMGNTTTPFIETRYVKLFIVEISKNETEFLLNESTNFINEMNSSGFKIKAVEDLYNQMADLYGKYDFGGVKETYGALKAIYDAAYASQALIEELTTSIAEAEKNGIDVTDTKRLLYTAEAIFQRGEYVLAIARLKEAKTVFALETKGEYSLLYDIKNNPLKFLGILIGLSLFGAGSSVGFRYRLYKSKIKLLTEEEALLLQLMKVIQKECFESNKISMGEYQEAMAQYEKRLAETIEEKITTETKLSNLLKVKGKKLALQQEKARLISSMKDLQERYLSRGILETRVYENTLKSYSTRLAKVDEQLVYLEASEYLGKEVKIKK